MSKCRYLFCGCDKPSTQKQLKGVYCDSQNQGEVYLDRELGRRSWKWLVT